MSERGGDMSKINRTASVLLLIIIFSIISACNGSDTKSDHKNFEIRNMHLYTTVPATFDSCMVNHDNYWDQLANCDHQIIWPDWQENGTAYKVYTVDASSIIVIQLYGINRSRNTALLGVSINGGAESKFDLDFSEWGQLEDFEIGIDILSDSWVPGTYELNYWLENEYGIRTPVYTLEVIVEGPGGLSGLSREPAPAYESLLLDFEVLGS